MQLMALPGRKLKRHYPFRIVKGCYKAAEKYFGKLQTVHCLVSLEDGVFVCSFGIELQCAVFS